MNGKSLRSMALSSAVVLVLLGSQAASGPHAVSMKAASFHSQSSAASGGGGGGTGGTGGGGGASNKGGAGGGGGGGGSGGGGGGGGTGGGGGGTGGGGGGGGGTPPPGGGGTPPPSGGGGGGGWKPPTGGGGGGGWKPPAGGGSGGGFPSINAPVPALPPHEGAWNQPCTTPGDVKVIFDGSVFTGPSAGNLAGYIWPVYTQINNHMAFTLDATTHLVAGPPQLANYNASLGEGDPPGVMPTFSAPGSFGAVPTPVAPGSGAVGILPPVSSGTKATGIVPPVASGSTVTGVVPTPVFSGPVLPGALPTPAFLGYNAAWKCFAAAALAPSQPQASVTATPSYPPAMQAVATMTPHILVFNQAQANIVPPCGLAAIDQGAGPLGVPAPTQPSPDPQPVCGPDWPTAVYSTTASPQWQVQLYDVPTLTTNTCDAGSGPFSWTWHDVKPNNPAPYTNYCTSKQVDTLSGSRMFQHVVNAPGVTVSVTSRWVDYCYGEVTYLPGPHTFFFSPFDGTATQTQTWTDAAGNVVTAWMSCDTTVPTQLTYSDNVPQPVFQVEPVANTP